MTKYLVDWIWQNPEWPNFQWNSKVITPLLQEIRVSQGKLLGQYQAIAQDSNVEFELDTLLANLISSYQIEGETLNAESVRSSIAKRLDIPFQGTETDQSEQLAELILEAIKQHHEPLTQTKLLEWHTRIFAGYHQQEIISNRDRLYIGQLRGNDVMQVVSGRLDRPKVHFEAPDRVGLEDALEEFIHWFNASKNSELDPLIRAAICHLWLLTLHPFEDGNGRITRMLTDSALAFSESQSIRLYSMSSAILADRKGYYQILEKTQRGDTEITEWLLWFFQTLQQALTNAEHQIHRVLNKTRFWQTYRHKNLLPAQIKVLNRLLDGGEKGFEYGISASQYQKVAKVSKATATRHLTQLLDMGCIVKLEGGGRNTRYQVRES